MAKLPVKQAVESITANKPDFSKSVDVALLNLEDAIADQLLDSIDWAKVRSALLKKAPAKLFAWLTSGNNSPINISQYPELAALPSSEDEGKAA